MAKYADLKRANTELAQALAVMVEVFPPRSDPGPDAYVEQVAHAMARDALAKHRPGDEEADDA